MVEPYWRIYAHPEDGLVPVCLQWFDEYDYDHRRYLGGESAKFATEEDARAAIAALKHDHPWYLEEMPPTLDSEGSLVACHRLRPWAKLFVRTFHCKERCANAGEL